MDKINIYRIILSFMALILLSIIIYTISYINKHINIFNTLDSHELFDVPFHIKAKSEKAQKDISGVPLVIYQSWHTNKVPKNMKLTIYKLLDMNPEFDYYLYSDEKSREYIKNNYGDDVVTAFDTLKPGAYKSDLWRYCILYKTGGVYLDIKYYSRFPIVDMIKKNPVIFVKDLPLACSLGIGFGVYNAFMVSPPNNPIFLLCINEIINNTKFRLYKSGSLDVTGPCLLSRKINDYDKSKSDSEKIGNKLVYNFTRVHTYFETIWYKDEKAFLVYDKYRAEQKMFQNTEHYGKMWDEKNIYI